MYRNWGVMAFFLPLTMRCNSATVVTTVSLLMMACLFALTGCQALPQASEHSSGETTIRFATWGSAEELRVMSALVQRFESEHPHLHVDVMHIPDNYDQKIHLLAASGLLPDVVTINSWGFPKYACYEFFTDLTPFMAQSTQVNKSQFFDTSLAAFKLGESGVGAIPRDVSNVLMYVNTDLLTAHGEKLPSLHWDKQKFLTLARRLTLDTNQDGQTDVFGTSFYRSPPLFWLPWLWSDGGELMDESGQFVLEHPSSIQALQELHQFVAGKQPIAPSRQQVGQTTMTQLFLQQKVATLVNGRWIVPLLREQATFKWDVWPMPSGKNGSVTGVDATGYAMSSAIDGKQQEAAWQWIEFLSSASVAKMFAESGLIVPARHDVAESSVFVAPSQQPSHAHLFLETLEQGHPTRSHPKWQQIQSVLELGLEPVWDKETPWKTDELTAAIHSVKETLAPVLNTETEGTVCRQMP
jgi:multiple sugar transport system substrate-binding protein